MAVLQLQCAPWDKIYNVSWEGSNYQLQDRLIIAADFGQDLARVLDIVPEATELDNDVQIIRKATAEDLVAMPTDQERQSAWRYGYDQIKNLSLDMKLIDVHYTWDRSRLTFAFVANGRVDFRELVKELTNHFNKNIRLQQIGIRDESKLTGDIGRCGRDLCCRQYLTKFTSVTGDMAETQQLASRGSDRISGNCGRLMCCLSYEVEGYQEKSGKMPPLGARVNVDGRKGEIISHNLLKESVNVRFDPEKGEESFVAEIDLNRHKKKN